MSSAAAVGYSCTVRVYEYRYRYWYIQFSCTRSSTVQGWPLNKVRRSVAEVSCLNHEDLIPEIRYGKAFGPAASTDEARFGRNPVELEV